MAERRVDPARAAAYDVLTAVRVDDAYANLALPAALDRRRVRGRDAAFTTELVSGTLRGRGSYDAILAACVDRDLAKVQAKILDALRLGTHQLLAMRVPPHAAISTTVDLVRTRFGAGPAGFVNACLRKVSTADLATWLARVAPDPATDPVGNAAVTYSHPAWVVSALAEALGERAEELPALLAADNAAPGVVLAARPGLVDRDDLVAQTGGEATEWSPYGVRLASGDPGALAAVAAGAAGVQDEGSQLVAHALAHASVSGADRRWLDLCAGPGGKAALLAALAAGRSAGLVAAERAPHRAGLVGRALTPVLGPHPPVLVADGTRPAWPLASFDRILVDAPCSGLGALRRRPESRWRRRPEDLATLVPLQTALLRSAVDSVRPGGVVCYATCSPVIAETAEVVTAILDDRHDLALEPVPLDVPDAAGPLPGTVQLWPHRHRTDAMFVALLRRGSR